MIDTKPVIDSKPTIIIDTKPTIVVPIIVQPEPPKPPSAREKIIQELLVYYDDLIERFKQRPVIQTTELIQVKFISTDVGYITLVEIKLEPEINPE